VLFKTQLEITNLILISTRCGYRLDTAGQPTRYRQSLHTKLTYPLPNRGIHRWPLRLCIHRSYRTNYFNHNKMIENQKHHIVAVRYRRDQKISVATMAINMLGVILNEKRKDPKRNLCTCLNLNWGSYKRPYISGAGTCKPQ
jgi:hypothetical protein